MSVNRSLADLNVPVGRSSNGVLEGLASSSDLTAVSVVRATFTHGLARETRISYDVVANDYAEFVRGSLDGLPVLRSVLVLFAELVRGGGPVLDLGCGPGQVITVVQEVGLDMVGVDLSPAMIEIARRDYPGTRYEVGSMTNLTHDDGSAAGALLFWSLIHVPDAFED